VAYASLRYLSAPLSCTLPLLNGIKCRLHPQKYFVNDTEMSPLYDDEGIFFFTQEYFFLAQESFSCNKKQLLVARKKVL